MQNRAATLALYREARRRDAAATPGDDMSPYAVTDLETGESYIVTPVTLF